MGHGGNVIAELAIDHREVEDLFRRFESLIVGDPRRRELANRFTIELVRHSVAEEMYLYPAVRDEVPGGAALADKEIEDHAEVEELLKRLEKLDVADADFHTTATRLIADVKAHVADEEGRLFPALEQVCTPARLHELGDQVRAAKSRAPTRPHPSAPDTPPGDKLLAPGAGLVDRARDFVSGRGR